MKNKKICFLIIFIISMLTFAMISGFSKVFAEGKSTITIKLQDSNNNYVEDMKWVIEACDRDAGKGIKLDENFEVTGAKDVKYEEGSVKIVTGSDSLKINLINEEKGYCILLKKESSGNDGFRNIYFEVDSEGEIVKAGYTEKNSVSEVVDFDWRNEHIDAVDELDEESYEDGCLVFKESELVDVTIHYKEQGTDKILAEDVKYTGVDGTTRKAYSKSVDGYIATSSNDYVETTKGSNEYTFYYIGLNNFSYTVNYLEKDDPENVIKEPKVVTGKTYEDVINSEDEIIEIAGYQYDSVSKKSITISRLAWQNVINIYYTKVEGYEQEENTNVTEEENNNVAEEKNTNETEEQNEESKNTNLTEQKQAEESSDSENEIVNSVESQNPSTGDNIFIGIIVFVVASALFIVSIVVKHKFDNDKK